MCRLSAATRRGCGLPVLDNVNRQDAEHAKIRNLLGELGRSWRLGGWLIARLPAMGLFRGFFAPLRAVVFLSTQRMWHLVVVPVLVNVALAAGTAWGAGHYFRQEVAGLDLKTSVFGSVLFWGLTALAAVILFIVLQPLLGAVFNDHLSERIEHRVTGTVPKVAFLTSVGRALLHGFLKLVLYGLALAVGAGLFVTGVGVVFATALGVLFLAYDGFDYPLARRGAGFGAKWRYLLLHPGQTIGYGLGATLLYFVPLALVVAPPLCAAGATVLYLETEKRTEERRTRKLEAQKQAKSAAEAKASAAAAAQRPSERTNSDEAGALRNGQG
jgi:uncharacterized protein involved in cysteine biosynthesis